MQYHRQTFKKSFNYANSNSLLSGGVLLNWLATGNDTGGLFSLFEAKGIQGMEPPPHVHNNEDETYYLLDGEMSFKVGDVEFTGGPGDFIFLPRLIPHEFKVISPSFHCLVGLYPAGLENYFDKLCVPHHSKEIPPVNSTPPSAEDLEMMNILNKQFGITYMI